MISKLWKKLETNSRELEKTYEKQGFITETDISSSFGISLRASKVICFFLVRSGDYTYYYESEDQKKYEYKMDAPKGSVLSRKIVSYEDFYKIKGLQPNVF